MATWIFCGKVIDFVLEYSNIKESICITGEKVYFNGIEETVKRFQYISIVLIHVGSAQFRYLTGFGQYIMNRKGFMKTVRTINAKTAIPIHNNGWTHFKESNESVAEELERNPDIKEKVLLSIKGKEYTSQLN